MLSNRSLKFIHITKTGGTSIEDITFAKNVSFGRIHKEYGYWHELPIMKSMNLINKYDWFTFVRNPYERIVSEYYWEAAVYPKQNLLQKTLNEMNQYLRFKITKRSHTGDHYTEQYKYILDKKMFVGKFENIVHDFNHLMHLYNMNIRMYHNNNNNHFTHNYTVFDLDDDTIQLINKVYKYDFVLFEYEMKTAGKAMSNLRIPQPPLPSLLPPISSPTSKKTEIIFEHNNISPKFFSRNATVY